jgi:hypothetical protein
VITVAPRSAKVSLTKVSAEDVPLVTISSSAAISWPYSAVRKAASDSRNCG